MALTFISVSGLLCERVLQEGDAVFSAIRIIDIFNLAHDALPNAVVEFTGLVLLRAMPSEEQFRVGVAIVGSSGERNELPEPPGNPFKLPVYDEDPSVPVGFGLVLQFQIGASKMGTNYIDITVNGLSVVRKPFTLRRLPAPHAEE